MAMVMMTVKHEGPAPSLAEIEELFGLSDKDVDPVFGVIEIDPQDHLYAFMVDEGVAARLRGKHSKKKLKGPYSNPRIEPFGP